MRSISERMKQTRETQSATEQKAEAVSRVRRGVRALAPSPSLTVPVLCGVQMMENLEERLSNREAELEASQAKATEYESQVRQGMVPRNVCVRGYVRAHMRVCVVCVCRRGPVAELLKQCRQELEAETTARKQLVVRFADAKEQLTRQQQRVVLVESEAKEARAQAEAALAAKDAAVLQVWCASLRPADTRRRGCEGG